MYHSGICSDTGTFFKSSRGRRRVRMSEYAALLLLLAGCGGGGGGAGGGGGGGAGTQNTLGGVMNVANFSIPAGQTLTVGQDLTIQATGKIEIDGTLLVPTDTNVALLANGPVVVNGLIGTAPAGASKNVRRLPAGRAVNTNVAILISGSAVTLGNAAQTKLSTSLQAPAGSDIYLACTAPGGTITIEATVETSGGANGTGTMATGPLTGFPAPGQNAGGIQIGTTTALSALKAAGVKTASAPTSLVIGQFGLLNAGSGGDGQGAVALNMNALNPNTAVAFQIGANTLAYANSSGGSGGGITIAANNIKTSGTRTYDFTAGAGGKAGDFGSSAKTLQPPKAPAGRPGSNVVTIVASGGQGGAVSGAPERSFQGGARGVAGTFYVGGGDGGDGATGSTPVAPGVGGNLSVYVWTPPATQPATPATMPLLLQADILGGSNGGKSNDSQHPGANGGVLALYGVAFDSNQNLTTSSAPQLTSLYVSNFGSGGQGWDGCGSTPPGAGTGGGSAGTALNKAAQTAFILNGTNFATPLMGYANIPHVLASFNGGDGGGGMPPGPPGMPGKDDTGKTVGDTGTRGTACNGCGAGTYSATHIGPGQALAVNHLGHAVGTAPVIGAWFWNGSTQQSIGTGTATAINDSDVVAGYLGTSGAWVWDKTNGRQALPDMIGGTNSYAYGINNAGVIVGQAAVPLPGSPAGFTYAAVEWINLKPKILPSITTYDAAEATAINASGVVVGWERTNPSGTSPSAIIAVQWTNGIAHALQPLKGGTGGTAYAISPTGDVVGLETIAFQNSTTTHAVIWKAGGTATDLGPGNSAPLSQALGVSGATIVGYTGVVQTGSTGVLFNGSAVVSLQSVMCVQPGQTFYQATGVNDSGMIVANSMVNYLSQAYLLTPN